MFAKTVCLALVFVTCECNGSRIVYLADPSATGNIPGSIPIGPFSNLPSSDQSDISNSPNNLQTNAELEQKPNIPNDIQSIKNKRQTEQTPNLASNVPNRPPIGEGQLSNIAGGTQDTLPLGQGPLNPRAPTNSVNNPSGAGQGQLPSLPVPGAGNSLPLGQITNLLPNEQSNIPLGLPAPGPSNVQSIIPNLPGTIQNIQAANPNNLQDSLPLGEVSNIPTTVQNIAGLPVGGLSSIPSGVQNSNEYRITLPAVGQLSNVPGSVQNINSGSQSGNIGSTGLQSGSNGNNGQNNNPWAQLISLLTNILQNSNSSNSQNSNNGNTGSQSGNNGNTGTQSGNNGNSESQNDSSGSQIGNNGNTASQSTNNGNTNQNSNSGAQNGNSGNSGSQSGNNGNTGSQVGTNDNSSPNGNDNGVSGESSNAGSQSGNNGNIGSQGGNSGNNNQNTEDSDVERPCHVSFEECIKQYFLQHAKCAETYEHVPDPLIRPLSTTFLTRVNLSVSATDVIYSGLNGNIEEFFINRETDRLVITIQFRNVTVYSKDAIYRFHRRAREPVVNVDYFFTNIRSVSTTTIIPVINNLQLDRSETIAFVDDANPRFNFGPRAFVSSDPNVRASLQELLAERAIIIQEFFLTEAAFFAATYIQNKICDFGLEVL